MLIYLCFIGYGTSVREIDRLLVQLRIMCAYCWLVIYLRR